MIGQGLVLSRRPGEVIIIGDDVRVTLLSLENGCAEIAVWAPKEVPVDRLEIRERKNKERENAA